MKYIAEIALAYTPTRQDSIFIKCSKDAYDCFLKSWNKDLLNLQEEFKVLLVNQANRVLGIVNLSKGGMTGTVVDTRILYAVTLKSAAVGIILCHNHPSGNLSPSKADRKLVDRVAEGCKTLDIKLLDNLIISSEGYKSFADEGML
jgi:DNA repair protein RadC